MAIRLRPHHLLCVLTFAGDGYSPSFVSNFTAIVERIGGGEAVLLVAGPDDICAPLVGTADEHCSADSVGERDREALLALTGSVAPDLAAGALSLEPAAIEALRRRFAAGTIRGACHGCSWWSLCTDIAERGFARAQL